MFKRSTVFMFCSLFIVACAPAAQETQIRGMWVPAHNLATTYRAPSQEAADFETKNNVTLGAHYRTLS